MKDELEDLVYRMQITKLESQLALREIECDGLSKEITGRRITPDRMVAAIERRDELQGQCAQLVTALDTLRHTHR